MTPLIQNTRRPDITFHSTGRILIAARIARILGLSPGDSINIAFHEGEYLLYAKKNRVGRHEAQCHPTKKGSHNFCANSVSLSRKFLALCKISAPKVSFMLGEQIIIHNQIYLPIITRSPIFYVLEEGGRAD